MGCAQGTAQANAVQEIPKQLTPQPQRNQQTPEEKAKVEDEKCKVKIGNRCEVEVAEPEVLLDFDSMKHEVDAADLSAMKKGHALPMNLSAHHILQGRMDKSLCELTADPAKLKKAVKQRRLQHEDIAAFKSQASEASAKTSESCKSSTRRQAI
ncbi:unnamed protein product [Effrenium voratum]|uniref:Uncharacterized protein n=1 Tax=Effrenium voratum TaxID=2562239 RepID=A0AA36HXC7_9DINO|nr:unnamed protein product [Effrenium voratum]CAJ1377108.1 unnamed protein product [Effrenium voratum]CAJ1446560.1 unnamed protein product [Effrenium voratum]|mmetsp:Transcript_91514/g.218155  ORF Transcript_91514/g.218155 Transcript_91514/m.218155 type:complete len:154 (-) Transcript_91514:162-623(-)|eukprot:CAMPEP_0181452838 /NCGR_PEP_ID=MMETSP1110-20121109/29416_1 /TAXON_ID=174948 /ORGANISM="Symbiodinium sp., Strain CCMP421" /LENGTH=153 /DNA_ID=CAMNT_0023577139 /DNA_START=63 /DNA_END=524 /DNA_ORIENTATION=+